jgi:hypothetical protein
VRGEEREPEIHVDSSRNLGKSDSLSRTGFDGDRAVSAELGTAQEVVADEAGGSSGVPSWGWQKTSSSSPWKAEISGPSRSEKIMERPVIAFMAGVTLIARPPRRRGMSREPHNRNCRNQRASPLVEATTWDPSRTRRIDGNHSQAAARRARYYPRLQDANGVYAR